MSMMNQNARASDGLRNAMLALLILAAALAGASVTLLNLPSWVMPVALVVAVVSLATVLALRTRKGDTTRV